MPGKVADLLWEMLAKAGVKRCYGILGDALNPTEGGRHEHIVLGHNCERVSWLVHRA